ncbi:MAG: ion transporter [Rhodobacteraceae bacterium]|nr:ion transporter [Paracoccaceae bacterium]
MNRTDITPILDGTHEAYGNGVAWTMNLLIILSAIAIAMETEPSLPAAMHLWLKRFEILLLGIFTLEYLLRLFAADRPLRYALSFWGLVDLLTILPAIAFLTPEWQAVRVLRLIRLVRLLKLFRSSRALDRLAIAFQDVRGELMVFGVTSGLVLYVAAVGIYLFEHEAQPAAFSSIPMSLWWAVASFTTVGYGDLIPITAGGRVFTTFVLFIGLGIIAVPAAIVTTALLEAETNIGKKKKKKSKKPKKTEATDSKTAQSTKGD